MSDRAEMNLGDSQYSQSRAKSDFVFSLEDLMRRYGVIVDHNHDAEALDSGWHFRFPNGAELTLGELYRRTP